MRKNHCNFCWWDTNNVTLAGNEENLFRPAPEQQALAFCFLLAVSGCQLGLLVVACWQSISNEVAVGECQTDFSHLGLGTTFKPES